SSKLIRSQLSTLNEIDSFIDDYLSTQHPVPKTAVYNQDVLPRFKKLVDLERTNLTEQLPIASFSETYGVSGGRLFDLYSEPLGRKVIGAAVAAAAASKPIEKLLRSLVERRDIKPATTLRIIPLIVENISLRKYMAQLDAQHASFKPENLERFALEETLLTDFFDHMITARNLPRDPFVRLLDQSIDKLFRGEENYQAIVSRMAMELPKPVTMLAIAAEFTEG